MAIKKLFKPIDKALQGHIQKIDKSGNLLTSKNKDEKNEIRDLIIEEQVNDHVHELYYTNEWVGNTVQTRVQAYLLASNKGTRAHSISNADANILNTKILPIITKKTKKHNTQKWWRDNLKKKNIVVASKATGKPKRKDKRRARTSGYAEVRRGTKAGGASS